MSCVYLDTSTCVCHSLYAALKCPAGLRVLLYLLDIPLNPDPQNSYLAQRNTVNMPPTELTLLDLCQYQLFFGAGRRNSGFCGICSASGVFLRTCLYFPVVSACFANLAFPLKAQGSETCGVPLWFSRGTHLVPLWMVYSVLGPPELTSAPNMAVNTSSGFMCRVSIGWLWLWVWVLSSG